MKSTVIPVLMASLMLAQFSAAAPARTTQTPTELKELLNSNLAFMKSVYEAQYAPKEWKKKHANWELNQAYAEAVNAVNTMQTDGATIDPQVVREIVKKFIYSTKDYHVSVRFYATELASLPFTVKSAEGKVFLAFIDRTKLSESAFPFNVGDEVILFDGKSASDAITEVQSQLTANVPETDRAQAEIKLTNRKAASGYKIPSGAISVSILPKGKEVAQSIELHWDYTPEKLNAYPGLTQKPATVKSLNSKRLNVDAAIKISNLQMFASGIAADLASPTADTTPNPFTLGSKKSYIPTLGQKIWQADDANTFDAYIYKTDDRKLIGVIRIPSYSLPKSEDYIKAAADFAKIVTLFQVSTDALVIDQINNPGGSVFYLYQLASMLTDQPLKTPRHRMSMIQSDVVSAIDTLSKLESVTDDETAKKVMGESWNGFPITYQVAQFFKGYSQFMITEWNKGKTITSPFYIAGANQINPSPARYTKPLLVVVNELCFSGGDFFPAILQDNKRATVMGVRTAGAGGYVQDVTYPNALGIQTFRVTASIAERVDLNPIENLGVTPDLAYKLTAADLQGGFAGYKTAIKTTIEAMVK